MPRISLVEKAHRRIAERLGGYDVAVDATVGNGHDLLFLAECVGQEGRVYGFDVQQSALDAARERLDKTGSGTRVTLFLCGHESMYDRIPAADRGRIAAVMFNLGYLPGGDKTVTTRANSTLAALDAACQLLAEKGRMTIVAYPGHPGGLEETNAVTGWLGRLDGSVYRIESVEIQARKTRPPVLYVVDKLGHFGNLNNK